MHGWTVSHHAFHPAFVAQLPYTLITVNLEEGARALGRWAAAGRSAIGLAAQGRFVVRPGGVDLVFCLNVVPPAPATQGEK